MKCRKIFNNMETYLGGNLSPRRKRRFDNHLARCEKCRAELERCRKENALYKQALMPYRLQGTFRNIVLGRLRLRPAYVQRERQAAPRKVLWLAPVAAAAQFLLAFWLSGIFMFGGVKEEVVQGTGTLVSINWTLDLDRYLYFSSKGDQAPDQEPAGEDTQVD